MKKLMMLIASAVMALALAGCGGDDAVEGAGDTAGGEVPAADMPATDAPATDAPATDAPPDEATAGTSGGEMPD